MNVCVDSQAKEIRVEYDRWGRMKYHPEFHHNYRKSYTVKELAYICKHYGQGNLKTLSLDVGRTEQSLRTLVYQLKKKGLYEYYKNLNIGDDG